MQAHPLLRPLEARAPSAAHRPRAERRAPPCTISCACPIRADPQCGTLVHLEPELPAGCACLGWGGRRAHAEETVRRELKAPAAGVPGDIEYKVG
jgi:hypothetical protein